MRHWLAIAWFLVPVWSQSRSHLGSPPCEADELQGEVQGASGFACVKKCDDGTLACPTDVPPGTTAQPQCMLADVDQAAFCALLCEMDSQCPSNARCRTLKPANVGICLTAVSFASWASNSQTRKLVYSLPTNRPGAQSPQNYAIAKTLASLQSLKSRYAIDDSDADMLMLKELLASIPASSGARGPVVAPNGDSSKWPTLTPAALAADMTAMVTGIADSASAITAGSADIAAKRKELGLPQVQVPVGKFAPEDSFRDRSPGLPIDEKAAVDLAKHDSAYIQQTVGGGREGIKQLSRDTLWAVENVNKKGVSSELLRGLFIVSVLYVALGAFIRSQAMGATGWDVVPHASFWADYPNLVSDGVTYFKILAGAQPPTASASSSDLLDPASGGHGGSGGSGSFDPL